MKSGKNHNQAHPKIDPIKVTADQTISSLLEEFDKSGVFGPGRIARATSIYTQMVKDNATIFLGLAGALVPGGMRDLLVTMINNGLVDVIVTTGANVTHDLIEAFGGKHIRQVHYQSDSELREKSIDRIYDAFVADESFGILESSIQPIFQEIYDTHKNSYNQLILSTHKLMELIGAKVSDKDSFVKAAYDNNVPIFIPAFGDSITGLQMWLFSQMNTVLIDIMEDLTEIQRIARDADKAGTFFLGGGVPKNYIFQSRLMSPKSFDYAIQITMDRVETGGLSGASLEESISWGKTSSSSKMVTIVSDITIALPLIVSGTLHHLNKSNR